MKKLILDISNTHAATKLGTPGARLDAQAQAERNRRGARWDDYVQQRGERYRTCDFGTFKVSTYEPDEVRQRGVLKNLERYCDTIRDRIKAGQSLVLYGPSGTGKDHLLTAVTRVAIRDAGQSVEWRSGADLYAAARDRMGDNSLTESDLVRGLVSAGVLCISDPVPPVAGQLTEYQAALLYRIIDGRYNRQRPTWLTCNVQHRDELEKRIGVATAGRLLDGALACWCDWRNFRKTAGK